MTGLITHRARLSMRTGAMTLVCLAALGRPIDAQAGRGAVVQHLARADSAFADGNRALAEREYLAVLELEPWNSRATYQLAQLRRDDPQESLRLLLRYAELEPDDPWGYMAVGDAYARVSDPRQALAWYDRALGRVPDERDAIIGRARILAGARYTDAAITAYEGWVARNPSDAEAQRELARELQRAGRLRDAAAALEAAQAAAPDDATRRRLALMRRLHAPAITPIGGTSVDSDDNVTRRAGASADFGMAAPARIGVSAVRTWVSDPATSEHTDAVHATLTVRPRATVLIEAAVGATNTSVEPATVINPGPGPGPPMGRGPQTTTPSPSTLHASGRFRLRVRAPGDGAAAELRLRREPLQASPILLGNDIVSNDLRGVLEAPVAGPLRLRGIGRATALHSDSGTNWRSGVGAVLAVRAAEGIELSGQFHHASFANPASEGYFAPRLIQSVEAGSYIELYPPWANVIAIDVGAGVQRTADHNAVATGWHPILHWWSSLRIPVGQGPELSVEVEGYRAQIGDVVAASVAGWSFGSITVGLRWAVF